MRRQHRSCWPTEVGYGDGGFGRRRAEAVGAGAPAPVGFGGGDLSPEAAGLRPRSSAVVRAGVGVAAVPGAGLRQRLLTAPGGGALLEAVGGGILLAAPGCEALLATREVGSAGGARRRPLLAASS